ncbi:MAG: metalloregulator ArsR/SmtB family transcription factor [Patescibacteria group bacterium]
MTILSYKSSRVSTRINPTLVLKILCNSSRYTLIKSLLSARKDLCVQEIAELASLSQSATSHQLAYLEARGVVHSVRMGKTKCYFLTNTPIARRIARIIEVLSS